jgi:lipopolysaccharide export system protein LptA
MVLMKFLLLSGLRMFLFALCCFAVPGLADAADSGAQEEVRIKISAQSMNYNPAARKIIFSGQVVVKHPNFTSYSDKMDLLLSEDKSSTASGADSGNGSGVDTGKVEKVIAYINVRILLAEGRVGLCDRAVYTVKDETVRMEGTGTKQAELTDSNKNKLSGDVVLFYLNENKSDAYGHVKADISSK